MSATTCARSGGAYLYRCVLDRELYWPLAQMQRDLDDIASGVLPAAPRAGFVRPAPGNERHRRKNGTRR